MQRKVAALRIFFHWVVQHLPVHFPWRKWPHFGRENVSIIGQFKIVLMTPVNFSLFYSIHNTYSQIF
jgi:hypothetical protein